MRPLSGVNYDVTKDRWEGSPHGLLLKSSSPLLHGRSDQAHLGGVSAAAAGAIRQVGLITLHLCLGCIIWGTIFEWLNYYCL